MGRARAPVAASGPWPAWIWRVSKDQPSFMSAPGSAEGSAEGAPEDAVAGRPDEGVTGSGRVGPRLAGGRRRPAGRTAAATGDSDGGGRIGADGTCGPTPA